MPYLTGYFCSIYNYVLSSFSPISPYNCVFNSRLLNDDLFDMNIDSADWAIHLLCICNNNIFYIFNNRFLNMTIFIWTWMGSYTTVLIQTMTTLTLEYPKNKYLKTFLIILRYVCFLINKIIFNLNIFIHDNDITEESHHIRHFTEVDKVTLIVFVLWQTVQRCWFVPSLRIIYTQSLPSERSQTISDV